MRQFRPFSVILLLQTSGGVYTGECLSLSLSLVAGGKLDGILESLPLNPGSWNDPESLERELISHNS